MWLQMFKSALARRCWVCETRSVINHEYKGVANYRGTTELSSPIGLLHRTTCLILLDRDQADMSSALGMTTDLLNELRWVPVWAVPKICFCKVGTASLVLLSHHISLIVLSLGAGVCIPGASVCLLVSRWGWQLLGFEAMRSEPLLQGWK